MMIATENVLDHIMHVKGSTHSSVGREHTMISPEWIPVDSKLYSLPRHLHRRSGCAYIVVDSQQPISVGAYIIFFSVASYGG